jgi:hypothetical protein
VAVQDPVCTEKFGDVLFVFLDLHMMVVVTISLSAIL